jgi:hypothetical protein
MPNTYTKIASVSVSAALGAASIDFASIPATYTDLLVKVCGREATGASLLFTMQINGVATNQATKEVRGSGAAASSGTNTIATIDQNGTGTTASVFGNADIYITNYASSTSFKGISIDSVSENNGASAYMRLSADVWSQNTAINQLTFYASTGNIAQYSTATLYGVVKS